MPFSISMDENSCMLPSVKTKENLFEGEILFFFPDWLEMQLNECANCRIFTTCFLRNTANYACCPPEFSKKKVFCGVNFLWVLAVELAHLIYFCKGQGCVLSSHISLSNFSTNSLTGTLLCRFCSNMLNLLLQILFDLHKLLLDN